MISVALVSALASIWLWSVLNDETGVLSRLNEYLSKREVTHKWRKCPWCSGAWFSIVASVSIFHPTDARTVVTALGAAGLTGLVGSYIAQENE